MYMYFSSLYFYIVPSEPRNLSYVNVTASSIRVFWDPPLEKNGIILSYTLEYEELVTGMTFVIHIPPGSEQERVHVLIEQLMEYDEYEVRVVASTDKGPGNYSRTLNVLTAEHGTYVHAAVVVYVCMREEEGRRSVGERREGVGKVSYI